MKKPTTKDAPSKTSPKATLGALAQKLGKKHSSQPQPSAMFLGGVQDAWRFYWVWALMVAAFLVLIGRAFWLQVLNVDFYLEKTNGLITTKQKVPAYRGMIVDTHQKPLAASSPLSNVVFSPYDYALAYYQLKKRLLKISQDNSEQTQARRARLQKALEKMDVNLKLLAQSTQVPYANLQRAVAINHDIDVDDDAALKAALPKAAGSKRMVLLKSITPELAASIMALELQGVYEEKLQKRYYLQPEPNAQLLGFMSLENSKHYKGAAGIEQKYNTQLAGKDGLKLVLLGNGAERLKEVKELTAQVAGQNIELTIDSHLQYILYKELAELGSVQSARSSSGIVVDVLTGDVLAMTSWPSFNANELTKMVQANSTNRVVADSFEPGSVMKPFTVAAALASGKYNINTTINTSPGSLQLGNYVIKDSANYGVITMSKLIQKSSNVASAKIALSLPNAAIADMQRRFGFGQKTSLGLPAEASGKVTVPTDKTRRATMAYGYGQSVTLAQLAQAYAALGNHGVMNHLRVVKSEQVPEPKQVISAQHAQSIVAMMQSVTETGGTGAAAAINGYHVAGKTGTIRRADPVKGGYAEGQYRNIFAGVAPASNPRFAVVILVEDPQKQKYAGQTVASVFAAVTKQALRLYNIPFDKPLNASQD